MKFRALIFVFCLAGVAAVAHAQTIEVDLPVAPKPTPVEPTDPAKLERAIERGVEFLLKNQNKDGSWGSAHRTKELNIYAPVPGTHLAFRAAVTAMCVDALMEVGTNSTEIDNAIDRGEEWLFENLPNVRRATADAIYNVWTHGYAIQTLVHLLDRKPKAHSATNSSQAAQASGNGAPDTPASDSADVAQSSAMSRQERIRELIRSQMDYLKRYEAVSGGWSYYDFDVGSKRPGTSSMSFVNATILIALYEAKQAGIDPPQEMVERAIVATKRQRKPDFSYFYGEYLKWSPMHPVNRPGGSLGRSQACNLALYLWGDNLVTDDVFKDWLNRLITRNLWLDIGRKRPIPHESWFSVAGYFYYYGHYYAARCIEQLTPEEQSAYKDQLAAIVMPLQEKDGTWWDFPLYDYHQQYGTAFAIMTLVRCRK